MLLLHVAPKMKLLEVDRLYAVVEGAGQTEGLSGAENTPRAS